MEPSKLAFSHEVLQTIHEGTKPKKEVMDAAIRSIIDKFTAYEEFGSPINDRIDFTISESQLSNIPKEQLKNIDRRIGDFLATLEEADVQPGTEITQEMELQLLKIFARRRGWRLADDLAPYIHKGDIIEIYDANGVQLYRNLTFLKFCSYSLRALEIFPFTELYERSEEIDSILIKQLGKILSNKDTSTYTWNMPPHFIKEKRFDQRKVFKIKLGHLSPITEQLTGEKVAVISTNSCSEHRIGLI